MKLYKIFIFSLSICLVLLFSYPDKAFGDVYVRGYTKKNGTYVSPHYRSDPDNSVLNNWSTAGNINPHTGAVGTKNPYPSSPSPSSYNSSTQYQPAYSSGSNNYDSTDNSESTDDSNEFQDGGYSDSSDEYDPVVEPESNGSVLGDQTSYSATPVAQAEPLSTPVSNDESGNGSGWAIFGWILFGGGLAAVWNKFKKKNSNV